MHAHTCKAHPLLSELAQAETKHAMGLMTARRLRCWVAILSHGRPHEIIEKNGYISPQG